MSKAITRHMEQLTEMRNSCPKAVTRGLSDNVIASYMEKDSKLIEAVDTAYLAFQKYQKEFPELLRMGEREMIHAVQDGICNFYGDMSIKPYVPLGARGPWIVTAAGAVIYNVGSYGMLSLGHCPQQLEAVLGENLVMANIMTPNVSQLKTISRLRREIGQTRGSCPYSKFVFLNSGSEVVTLASILADVNSKIQTDPGGRHAGKKIMFMSLQGSFHGRTGKAARLSDSTARYYTALATFRDEHRLITVPANDMNALEAAFKRVDDENVFIDSFFMEPVMGEGNPGKAISPEFYKRVREWTLEKNSLFVVDSIQAGFRTHGYLSVVDYPGFEKLDAPDMETYSKALNAGQFPVSALAMTDRAASLYRVGIYGNTMTGNPKALEVICAVMDSITPEIRKNIRDKGKEFLSKLEPLRQEFPGAITDIQGAGLLFSVSLDPARYKADGQDSLEYYMRKRGVNVIHGGKNALRFTPYFLITSDEVDLVVEATRDALKNGPKVSG